MLGEGGGDLEGCWGWVGGGGDVVMLVGMRGWRRCSRSWDKRRFVCSGSMVFRDLLFCLARVSTYGFESQAYWVGKECVMIKFIVCVYLTRS